MTQWAKNIGRVTASILTLAVILWFVAATAESKQLGLVMPQTEAFIARWTPSGGSELGSSQTFLLEFCDLMDVERPEASRPRLADNVYCFEKAMSLAGLDGKVSTGRIDLYKRGSFIWESKQGSVKAAAQDTELRRTGTAARETPGWDKAMLAAKAQGQNYANSLPQEEGHPPFLLVSDIG